MFDKDAIMPMLIQAIKRVGDEVDFADIRWENVRSLVIRGGSEGLAQSETKETSGGYVRVLWRGNWSEAPYENLLETEDHFRSVCEKAHALEQQEGAARLESVAPVQDDFCPHWTLHPEAVAPSEKRRLMAYYRSIAKEYPLITSLDMSYEEHCSTHWLVNSEGTELRQQRVDVRFAFTAVAERDGIRREYYDSVSSSQGFDCILNLEQRIHEVCRMAVQALDAEPLQPGTYTLICAPGAAGTFMHEAFAHSCEADTFIKNPEYLATMPLGRQIGPATLNIYSGGDHFQTRGALGYDDEGTPSRRNYLLKEGKLCGYMHTRQSATFLGMEATGNARAIDHRFPPIARQSVMVVEPGTSSLQEMLQGVHLGVYAISGGNGGAEEGEFDFTISYGYMIRDGKLAEMIRDIEFRGDVFTTLANVDMVGKDGAWRGGMCWKAGQGPLAIGGYVSPLRIRNVFLKSV